MKKLLGITVVFIALFALAACGGVTTTAATTAATTTAATTAGTTAVTTTGTGTTTAGTTAGTTAATTTAATTATTTEAPLEEVTLNVAINYTSGGLLMGLSYHKATAYNSFSGEQYTDGDLLPVWEAIGEKLNIVFNDVSTTSDTSTANQWTRLLANNFAGVDLVNGTGATIGPEGVNGNFVDLAQYLDQMPYLSAFLEANPSVKVSLTAADGGIYFTPYFDGFGEMEQMFLARIDWIEDILDAETTTLFDTDAGATIPTNYTRRQVVTPIDVDITVANADGTTRVVNKAYTANILDTLASIVDPTGTKLADAFRTHIQNTYGDQGYAKLSDVFAGTDAAYDTDELIALMYVVKANPKYLTRQHTDGVKTAIEVMFPRESAGNRIRNLTRSLEMFGMRGVFSRCEWLYFDQDGLIQDVRHEQAFVDAVNDLSDLYNDGLIVQNPETPSGTNWRNLLMNSSTGFITYDYNASSTVTSYFTTGRAIDADMTFQAILPPVVDWLGDGNYFHFTEAVRSVKNEAWGIPIHVADDQATLDRALMLVDQMYDYSTENSVGTIHLYGPVGWTDGTLEYGQDIVYKMSDEALDEMNTLAGGNMINYLRQYVGATMPIGHVRSLGLEFQTLSEDGQIGVDRINVAVAAGVLKLAGQPNENPWFQLSPTFYPLTADETNMITAAASFRTIYTDAAQITLVKYGFSGLGGSLTEADYFDLFEFNTLDVYELIYIKAYRDAYARILAAD